MRGDMAWTPAAGQVFNLIDWFGIANWNGFNAGDRLRVGGESGTDLELPDLSSFDGALRRDTSLFASHGALVITVPEPSRALLLLSGLLMIGMRRRWWASDLG